MLEDAYKELERKQKNMVDGAKFTEEEMGELGEIRATYINIQDTLGSLSVAKLRLEQQFNTLIQSENDVKNKYKETQDKETEFVSKITEKYGDGHLDLETGIFKTEGEKKIENDEK